MATPVDDRGHEIFTSGETRRIDVRSIEKELLGLWKSAEEAGAANGHQAVTRAAVLTLVAVVDGDDAAGTMTELIARLTEIAPCRALIIKRVAEEADPPITAVASAHCHKVAGGRQVCCEQVTVSVSPSGVRNVPGLVTPLFIPDLPVFVYWPDALAETRPGFFPELLERLSGQVEYIVVDSGRARDPMIAMTLLADLVEKPGVGRPRPRDLNWSRLLTWREAVADLFEAPERRAWPAAIRSIHVRAAAGADSEGRCCFPSRPMLLVAWLSQRLGWTRTGVEASGDLFRIRYAGDRRAEIRLSGRETPRGRLEEVECRCSGGHAVALRRQPDGRLAVSVEGGAGAHEEMLTRRAETEEILLGEEFGHRERDHVFEAALIESAELVRASLSGASA